MCAAFFRKLFGIGQRRVNTIAYGCKTGEGVLDKRGGDHKAGKYGAKRKKVTEFISHLQARESHYSRRQSQRLYLPSDLSINKLFNMYNNSVTSDLKVKKTFFTKIFNTKFNLGFGTPASDTCSYCHRMYHQMKTATDIDTKNKLMIELGSHKLRARAFHKLMKQTSDCSLTFAFDLQQVQPLPKLSIGEAYYSRQISLYSFCVTNVKGTEPTFYIWNETQAGRGSQEISSAITDFLKKLTIDTSVTFLRLFADGCAGQNKNQHVIHAVALWLFKESPVHVTDVLLCFPVRGHSFLPPDRVFGRVEKKLRKISEILNPNTFQEVYAEVGETRILGKDWEIFDFKELSKILRPVDGISDLKRIHLKKYIVGERVTDVKIKTHITYYSDDPSKRFLPLGKRGYSLNKVSNISKVSSLMRLKQEKKDDVEKLLSLRFGNNWRENEILEFFTQTISLPCNELIAEDTTCDCLEEEPVLGKIL